MRTSHVLAALLLSALAAAASPANALPDASTRAAISERASGLAWTASSAADHGRSSARQPRDAASAQRLDRGGGVVMIAASTMVLVIAVLLLIALV